MDRETQQSWVKKQQNRNLVLVAGVAIIALLGISYWMDNKSASSPRSKDKIETVNLATPLTHVDAQSIWVERAQNQLEQQSKNTTALSQQLQLFQQTKETEDKQVALQAQTLAALQAKVSGLETKLTEHHAAAANSSSSPFSSNGSDNVGTTSDGFMSDDTLQLTSQKSAYEDIPAQNPDSFVPAGTIVRALVLEGADTPAGITSQGNPSPMLLRMLDGGSLPNHRHSHLKGCVATAAGVGDISSERGQVRLERISCVFPNNQVVELPVEATVAGPDGKDAIAGHPLWRDGPVTQRAFIAGTLSGLGNGIAQSYTSTSLMPYGPVQTVNNGRIMQYGLANGVSNAAEKLADYYIKQADQYHPVIQLSAGTVVDVIFLKGFYLDGKKHSEKESEITVPKNTTDSNSLWTSVMSAPTTTAVPNSLPLTAQEIEHLKQKNTAQGY